MNINSNFHSEAPQGFDNTPINDTTVDITCQDAAKKLPDTLSKPTLKLQQHSFPPPTSRQTRGLIATLGKSRSVGTDVASLDSDKPASPLSKSSSFLTKIFSKPKDKPNTTHNTSKGPMLDLEISEPCSIKTLLDDDKKNFGSMITIESLIKNVSEIIDVTIPPGMSAKDHAKAIYAQILPFKAAVDSNAALPQVFGKDITDEHQKLALKNLAGQLKVGDEWLQLLGEALQKNADKCSGKLFFSTNINTVLEKMDADDIKSVSSHLISVCTIYEAGARHVVPETLKQLLHDPRIEGKFPNQKQTMQFKQAILDAAHHVTVIAARKQQGMMVFAELKGSVKERQEIATRWEFAAKLYNGDHLDIEGINIIAKAAHLNLAIEPKDDANYKVLQNIINIKEAISQLGRSI